jgi:type II secretory pathway component PulM
MHFKFTLFSNCFCFLQQASVYLQEMNKLKTELESAQNEICALKEISLSAPQSSHLDEVFSIVILNFIDCLSHMGMSRNRGNIK